jgi:hypothetical protein
MELDVLAIAGRITKGKLAWLSSVWLHSAPRTQPSEAAANRERDKENQKQQKSH